MKIKKGDQIKILAGKDRGKVGKVLKVFSKEGRVTVEGVNVYKKHVRPKKQGEKGELVTLIRPIRASNVKLLCSACQEPTRTGNRFDGEKRVRYCKKCKSTT